MRSVGLKVLKNKLSEYVRIASSGETVLVVDRDRVVAELNPPRPDRPLLIEDAKLQDLVLRGIVRPAQVTDGPVPRKPVRGGAKIVDELAKDREDR